MPKFFFHLHNDMDVRDIEGQELRDLAAAEAFATRQARALIGAKVAEEGRIILHHRIEIEDEDHARVGTVFFRDALKIDD